MRSSFLSVCLYPTVIIIIQLFTPVQSTSFYNQLQNIALPFPASAFSNYTQYEIDLGYYWSYLDLNYDLYWFYWYDNYYDAETIEEDLNQDAEQYFPNNASFVDYGTDLMRDDNGTFKSFTEYDSALWNQVVNTTNIVNDYYYSILGDYMGVGYQVSCSSNINTVLSEASEWDKAGAASASVLMALIPTLLTFGNL